MVAAIIPGISSRFAVLLNMDKYPMRRFLLRCGPFRLNRKAKTRASKLLASLRAGEIPTFLEGEAG
jgi:hypothetical protein